MNPFGVRYFDKAGREIDIEEMGRLKFGSPPVMDGDLPYWCVGKWDSEDGLRVSTVWLGLDHGWGDGPPVIFETMIFADDENHPWDQAMTRYCTLEGATEGHERTVTDLLNNRTPWFIAEASD